MNEVFKYIGIYLLGINLAGFVIMAIDKSKARRNAWRIPEATLFLIALAGGSIGSLLGMHICHHKTAKPKFYIGMPVILVVQILVVLYFLFLSPFSFKVM